MQNLKVIENELVPVYETSISSKVIYYNLNFTGKTKLYFFVKENANSADSSEAKM